MAKIIVEQSPLTSFLDELPKLLLQYQQLQLQDRERKESNQVKIIEHLINVNDTRNNKLQSEIDQSVKSYEDATGSIHKLPESETTGEALTVLDDLTGNVIDDLSTIAKEYINRGDQLRKTKDIIKTDIQQVGLIQDFYKGLGHTYQGGIDPEKWDIEDFSDAQFKSYMDQFPELKDVEAEPFFDALKRKEEAGLDLKIQALNKLISEEKIRGLKEERYESIVNKTGDADKIEKQETKTALTWYGQQLSNIYVRSGLEETKAMGLMSMDPENEYSGIQDTEQNPLFKEYLDMKSEVIKDLSILLNTNPTEELYSEYTDMLSEAEGRVVGGRYSRGDYTTFHNFVDRAYQSYKSSGKSELIEKTAQKMFGFNTSFDQFYNNERQQYLKQLLIPLQESGQVDTSSVEELSDELEWDNIFKDLENE